LISQGAGRADVDDRYTTTVQVGGRKGCVDDRLRERYVEVCPEETLDLIRAGLEHDYIGAARDAMAAPGCRNIGWDGLKAGVVRMSPYNWRNSEKRSLAMWLNRSGQSCRPNCIHFPGRLEIRTAKQRVAAGGVA